MDWNWQELIVAVVSALLGWLANIVRPAPGTKRNSAK